MTTEEILAELRKLNENIHTLSERLFDVQEALDSHAEQVDDLTNTVFDVVEAVRGLSTSVDANTETKKTRQVSTHELVDASRRSSKPWDN